MSDLDRGILLDSLWYLALIGGVLSLAWLLFDGWMRGKK